MNRQQKIELIQLLEERDRRERQRLIGSMFAGLYPWQTKFIANTAIYRETCLIAGNRTGKTFAGTLVDAAHATGDYPDNWPGHRFEHAPVIWCLGYSGEKTRDLLQTALVGQKQGDKFAGGLIPADRIVGYEAMSGTPNALRTLLVKHKSGNNARVQFWSYSQGQHALMGDNVDWFHIDEEPRDPSIYPQVLTRIAAGDKGKGGRGILTFTPENGRTALVIQFKDTPGPSQTCMTVGWDDAPHLSEQVKADLLASFPAHQRDMRTKGIPMLGHGRIYDMSEDFVTCTPFQIPAHWWLINGMDFGFDHPQAFAQMAIDRDSGMHYITRSWKQSRTSPAEAWGAVKSWAKHYPVAWPADGLQHEKGSGKQQKSYYDEAGFKMLPIHAQWPEGGNNVEPGLFALNDLFASGKLKIFAGQRALFDEFLQYHRDENGKIVKVGDDIMDAIRYCLMMERFAVPAGGAFRQYQNRPTFAIMD